IARSRHAAAELADQVALARPVAAQRAPELVIPFRPAGWELADLIAAKPDVPGFGDQLHVGQDWVLPKRGKERCAAVEAVGIAPERGGKVEPETVDMTDLGPD